MRACRLLASLLLSSLLLSTSALAQSTAQMPQTPQTLFQQVQRAHLFKDQKTFAEAVPHQPSAPLLTQWQRARTEPGFDLAAFVGAHFAVSGDAPA